MLKFFRNIRHSIIQSGNSQKLASTGIERYLLYAIGEILLVVIGILIALQINNWNQNRIDRIRSMEYHQRLIDDLDIVINYLESDHNRAGEVAGSIKNSVEILGSGALTDSTKATLDFTLNNFFQFVQIGTGFTTYEEMKSSGQLGLIYNPELRSDIASYLNYFTAIIRIYESLAEKVQNTDFIDPYVKIKLGDDITQNTIAYDFLELASDKKLINTLSRYGSFWQTREGFSRRLNFQAIELKKAIEQELKEMQ